MQVDRLEVTQQSDGRWYWEAQVSSPTEGLIGESGFAATEADAQQAGGEALERMRAEHPVPEVEEA